MKKFGDIGNSQAILNFPTDLFTDEFFEAIRTKGGTIDKDTIATTEETVSFVVSRDNSFDFKTFTEEYKNTQGKHKV